MDRKEWLHKLRMELHKLPRYEIDDAVSYYTEYFEEAGPENEAAVVAELGSPQKVAAQIKADYAVRRLDQNDKNSEYKEHKTRVGVIVAAVMGGILAAPIALPIAICLAVLAIVGIALVIAFIVTLAALAFGLVIGGIAILATGISLIVQTGAGAILVIGIGMLMTGVAILAGFGVFKLSVWLGRIISKKIRERHQKKHGYEAAGGYVYQGNVTSEDVPQADAEEVPVVETAEEVTPVEAEQVSLTDWDEPQEAVEEEPVEEEPAIGEEPVEEEPAIEAEPEPAAETEPEQTVAEETEETDEGVLPEEAEEVSEDD